MSRCEERMCYAHTLALLRCQYQAGSLVALPLCQRPISSFEEADLFRLGMRTATWSPYHIHSHESSPGRAVRLTKEALAAAPWYLSSAALNEVSLLRHNDRPKQRKEGPASLRIWRKFEDDPPVFFLSADVTGGLSIPGFSVDSESPLNATIQEDAILLVTTLTRKAQGPLREDDHLVTHNIEVHITLSRL